MVGKRLPKSAGSKKPKPLIPEPKAKPVSNRAVSFKEFKKVKNNFHLIFYPLELQKKRISSKSVQIMAARKPLEKANFSFSRLLLEKASAVSEVQRAYLEFDKKLSLIQAKAVSSRPSVEKRMQSHGQLKQAYFEFEKKTEKPLYKLYCFLKKKGLSNKDLGFAWWNVQPRPRK